MDYNQLVNKIVADTVVKDDRYHQLEYPCIVLAHEYDDPWGVTTVWGLTIATVDEELFEEYLPKIYSLGMVEVSTIGIKVNWAITPKYRDQRSYTVVLHYLHRSHTQGREHTYKVLSKRHFPKVHRWALVNGLTLDLHNDKLWLERGLVFLCKEDAIANAKAMVGIDPHK